MKDHQAQLISILSHLGFVHNQVDQLEVFALKKSLREWFPNNELVEQFSNFGDNFCYFQITMGEDFGVVMNYSGFFHNAGENAERLHELILNENFALRGMRLYLVEAEEKSYLEASRSLSLSEFIQLMEINALGNFLHAFAFKAFCKLLFVTHEVLNPGSVDCLKKDGNMEIVPVCEFELSESYFIEILKKHFVDNNIEITSIDSWTIGFTTKLTENVGFQTICKILPNFGITSLFLSMDNDLNLNASEIGKFNAKNLYSLAKLESRQDQSKSFGIQTDFIISEKSEVFLERFISTHKLLVAGTFKYFKVNYVDKSA